MNEQTKIRFFGVKQGKYPGAARDGCEPTSKEAVGWHVVVGGTQASIENIEDFAKHFESFLRYAYNAGVSDTKEAMRERFGL